MIIQSAGIKASDHRSRLTRLPLFFYLYYHAARQPLPAAALDHMWFHIFSLPIFLNITK